jgi:hypothetical protein
MPETKEIIMREDSDFDEIQKFIDSNRREDLIKEGIFLFLIVFAACFFTVIGVMKTVSFLMEFSSVYFNQIRVIGG